MTTQWHCVNCGKIYLTYKPSIDNWIAGLAAGDGLRNSQAGNSCWNCGHSNVQIVADN